MPLRPLEIHAHQHLDPVLGLHPTLADGDRDHGVVRRVRVGEQEVELARAQLRGKCVSLLRDLRFELGVALRQLIDLNEVTGAAFDAIPCRQQLPVLRCLARNRARARRIVPRAGLG